MTSRLQKLLSLSLTQLRLYLSLIPSTTRSPCLDLLRSGSYLILISSPTWIRIISLLNQTCISLMLPCIYRSLIWSKEDLLSLPDALPGHLTQVFTRSGYSYPSLPDLLTRLSNSLSALSRNLLPESIACLHHVLQTQLSPYRLNLLYTLLGWQPISTFTGLLLGWAYLSITHFLPYPTVTSLHPYQPLT
jgi:hypothetical protein